MTHRTESPGPVTVSVARAASLTGLSESHVRRHAPIVRVGARSLVPVAWLDEAFDRLWPVP